ncbi:MAG TPA: PilN domain-containing protein [Gemmatimonadaceae bacterium]|nr:PilN domain-containing protein [Gemmatimonadaceae bacterium]
MIEINLLPGATKKSKGRSAGLSLGAMAGDVRARIRDPYMLSAVAGVALAAAAIGGLHVTQTARASELAAREEQAVADSTRFATVLRERRKAEAKRDSVLRQLRVIRSIDEERFVWAHIMDEVSRALPPYTWLQSLAVTDPQLPPPIVANDTMPKQDPAPMPDPLKFRVVGNTVDMQALTRFLRILEASPFIKNVQLARTELAMQDGKEVTLFQFDAQYERPDKSVISTAPVSLSVR